MKVTSTCEILRLESQHALILPQVSRENKIKHFEIMFRYDPSVKQCQIHILYPKSGYL